MDGARINERLAAGFDEDQAKKLYKITSQELNTGTMLKAIVNKITVRE